MVTKSRMRVPVAAVLCLLASSAWAGGGPSQTAVAASTEEALECALWGNSCSAQNLCCPGTTCMTVPAYGNQLACCHSISHETGSCN